jgi:hypothetical protein
MTKLDQNMIDRLVAAGGEVVKEKAQQAVRSWYDDPDDRDREMPVYEPDDRKYWFSYRVVFRDTSPALAHIDFHGLRSVYYDAFYKRWDSAANPHSRAVIAAVCERLGVSPTISSAHQ